jgi:putative peptidoglycan lipid II flippase
MDENTVEIARQYVPVLLSGVVASGGLLVDQAMAAMLPTGSVSALAYGGRFVSVALALFGGSVASAATPLFAEMAARSDWEGCRRSLQSWAWMSGLAAALMAGLMIGGARMLVRVTFQHGVFEAQDSAAVARVLEMYAIQIPFFVSSRVFYRFLIVMRRTDLVLYCGVVNLGLDVVLNLVLMRWMGVAGIALATSLWAVSTLIFLGYWSWRVLPRGRDSEMPVRVG